jgi:hypothetical protein
MQPHSGYKQQQSMLKFFLMLAALLGLFVSVIQALIMATTAPQVTIACVGILVSFLIGLIATKDDL